MKNGLSSTGLYTARKAVAPKLGDLLVGADIITEVELNTALQLANQSDQPLGRMLVDLKYVEQKDIDNAVALQVLVLEASLSGATAIKVLGRCHRQDKTVQESLSELGWRPSEPKKDSELGLLLVDAALITQKIYDDAISICSDQNLTMGEYLVLKKLVPTAIVNGALQTAVLVAQYKISRTDSVLILQKVKAGCSYWDALSQVSSDSRTVRSGRLSLGEVLTQGGFISESERIVAVERAMNERQMLGELLVKSGVISNETLQSALQVQAIARSGAVTEEEAIEVLRSSSKGGVSIKETMERRTSEDDMNMAVWALDLLAGAGLLQELDFINAVEKGKQFGVDPLRGLVIANRIDCSVYEGARELVRQVNANEKSRSQAIVLLNYIERSRCTLEEAIEGISNFLSAGSDSGVEVQEPVTHEPRKSGRDFSSLEQALRRKLAPMFLLRFIRSALTLLTVFLFLCTLFKDSFDPTGLALLFCFLLILDTIRTILDITKLRKEMYALRALDIAGVQQLGRRGDKLNEPAWRTSCEAAS